MQMAHYKLTIIIIIIIIIIDDTFKLVLMMDAWIDACFPACNPAARLLRGLVYIIKTQMWCVLWNILHEIVECLIFQKLFHRKVVGLPCPAVVTWEENWINNTFKLFLNCLFSETLHRKQEIALILL